VVTAAGIMPASKDKQGFHRRVQKQSYLRQIRNQGKEFGQCVKKAILDS
jgi:hypothetical protein